MSLNLMKLDLESTLDERPAAASVKDAVKDEETDPDDVLPELSPASIQALHSDEEHIETEVEDPSPEIEDLGPDWDVSPTDDGYVTVLPPGDDISDHMLPPAGARELGRRLIQLADELAPADTSPYAQLAALNERVARELEILERRAMDLVGELTNRDAQIAKLVTDRDGVAAERDAVAVERTLAQHREAALQAHLDSLRTTPIWEITFAGTRVYVAAPDLPTAIRRFEQLKPGIAVQAVRAAGVTLMI